MTIATYSVATRFQLSDPPQSEKKRSEESGPVARIIVSVVQSTDLQEASISSDRLAPTRDMTRGITRETAYG